MFGAVVEAVSAGWSVRREDREDTCTHTLYSFRIEREGSLARGSTPSGSARPLLPHHRPSSLYRFLVVLTPCLRSESVI
jgi:hypothetical protein